MEPYQFTPEQILLKFRTSENGLDDKEAEKRLQIHGRNIIAEEKRKSILKIFLDQFFDFLILLLFAAGLLSFFTNQIAEGLVIAVVILINASVGFILEYRAEKSLLALKKIFPQKVLVIRNGGKKLIDAEMLAPGDVVMLSAGDRVAADLRIIESVRLEVNEANLTGEPFPVFKHSKPIGEKQILAEQKNMAFAGTIITNGTGRGIVVATGSKTSLGKIAQSLERKEEETPLQKRIVYFGKIITIFALIFVFVIFLLGLWRGFEPFGLFSYAIALLVSAVPESLPALLTVALAVGVLKMSRSKAIVRRLPAVETLASVNVICSDKTGTLTQNEITAETIWTPNEKISISGNGFSPEPKINLPRKLELKTLIKAGYLCNNSVLEFNAKEEKWKVIGDPIEGALKVLAEKTQISETILGHKRLHELFFESERRKMSVVYRENGHTFVYTKGAPESILKISSYILENGRKNILTLRKKKEVEKMLTELTEGGQRVLGFSFRELKNGFSPESEIESQQTFLGLIGFIDPPVPEIARSLELTQEAGIKTVIITGDHKLTTQALAREIGLEVAPDQALAGKDLDEMSDDELLKKIDNLIIFARTEPIQKERIVAAFKKKGYIVAVTGDGINDAPALKKADIGIAMGLRGQDVAREAADIVLADDSYSTIERAVQYGRTIYDNIGKSFTYLISVNFSELFLVAIAFLANLPQPLTILQILWINLITDTFPALALALDNPTENVMLQPPKDPRKKIFNQMLIYAAFVSAIALIVELLIFIKFLPLDLFKTRTMVFTFSVIFQLFFAFSIRSATPLWSALIRRDRSLIPNSAKLKNATNWYFIAAFSISFGLQLLILYSPLASYFEIQTLNIAELLGICLSALGAVFILEIAKVFRFHRA